MSGFFLGLAKTLLINVNVHGDTSWVMGIEKPHVATLIKQR